MGNANSSRRDDLPPSQGGKYTGFGSTPDPEQSNDHPSYHLSSHAAPTLDEFQKNPLGALSKGWGLFSSAVTTASREINETVVKPGMSRAQELYEQGASEDVKRYLNTASTQAKGAAGWVGHKASEGWDTVNDQARTRGGVDLNQQLGRLGIGKGNHNDQGYGQVGQSPSGDAFFDAWTPDTPSGNAESSLLGNSSSSGGKSKPAAQKKKDDWDDEEWKDF